LLKDAQEQIVSGSAAVAESVAGARASSERDVENKP
jgi:hypothetical protein